MPSMHNSSVPNLLLRVPRAAALVTRRREAVAESMFVQQESLQTQKCIVLLGHYTIWGTGRVSKSSASLASPYPTELPSALVSGQAKIMRCPSPPRRTVDSSSRKRSRRTETAMLQWRRAWQTVRGDAWHPEVQSCLSARK